MLISLVVAAMLTALCCYVHLLVLRQLKRLVDGPRRISHPLLFIILVLFATHVFEVVLFALALSGLDWADYGRLMGAVTGGPGWFEDHFYFSIASYTTLGIGDIVPEGPIRVIAGMEALTGLVLIAWSASFTYLAMERLWTRSTNDSDRL
ncbi:potassium channel family protein [Sphingomonas sp. LHG3406-1]|uniref:potassium channel family protein n=1 Tax=Sphingomonas sp. LHG3406-1 TaxID=2804617 RepID=UPI002610072A|nr:potassium channel family protein [Sphingomonas sp. LHG3406-1]